MSQPSQPAYYMHGYHPAVLRSHSWRTAANSAGFLLPYIRRDARVLDVGCGPGTITLDLARRYVTEGQVTGVDSGAPVIEQARASAAREQVSNVSFSIGDAAHLSFADDTFDVVFCHQVLQHVPDPIAVLREMRRVARKPGGLVAAREADNGGFVWSPPVPELDTWRDVYHAVAAEGHGAPNAGRVLKRWVREAGFRDDGGDGGGDAKGSGESAKVVYSSSTWCFAGPEEVAWWSDLWAERTVGSSFAAAAASAGVEDGVLRDIAKGWREWGASEDAWFSVLNGEVLCWV